MTVAIYQRLHPGTNTPLPDGFKLAQITDLREHEIVFWLVDEKREVAMPRNGRSNGEFPSCFYGVVVSEGVQA